MIEEKLDSLGISLPTAPKPAGSYIPVVVSKSLAFVSGQIPIQDGKVAYTGKVPTAQSIEKAQEAAKLCAINALAQLKAELGDLEKIQRIVKVSGYVNSEQNFSDHPKVINAASDFLYEVFGEKGKHTRIAIGANSLPFDSTVEVDLIAEIS